MERRTDKRVEAPLRPNMLLVNLAATSSTFDRMGFDHGVFNNSNFTNSIFRQTNLVGSSFHSVSFDGSVLEQCSLRGVELKNCDVEGVVINGIRIGPLLKLLVAPDLVAGEER